MAVRTKDEILELVKARVGDDSSDEVIGFIEDITDTLNDYEKRLSDSTDWKAKYEENDAEWREKYKARFFGKEVDETEIDDEEEVKSMKYEDLFEDVKGDK